MIIKNKNCYEIKFINTFYKNVHKIYNKKTTLDEFLKDIKISNLDLKNNCKKYNNNTFYLVINAYLEENKFITYKVPLKLNNCN